MNDEIQKLFLPKNSFLPKLKNFYSLGLAEAMAQDSRLHVFLQTKMANFYQLANLVSFESWEKYIQEEAELEEKICDC